MSLLNRSLGDHTGKLSLVDVSNGFGLSAAVISSAFPKSTFSRCARSWWLRSSARRTASAIATDDEAAGVWPTAAAGTAIAISRALAQRKKDHARIDSCSLRKK